MINYKNLDFTPFIGLSSKHLQMIVASFIPTGKAPASIQHLVDLGNGDQLSCEVSTPPTWKKENKTVAMIHGLGGNHTSGYMVRMARKFYNAGLKTVRINLRGCGSGVGLSKLPYSGGNSQDIFKVLQSFKEQQPDSEIILIGFSLGGNTALKLAGELGMEAAKWTNSIMAVCPPFDLEHSVRLIGANRIYQSYYLKGISRQAKPWTEQKFSSVFEYDDMITGPFWGYSGAKEYYENCSSRHFLEKIKVPTRILSAVDDPFVPLDDLKGFPISDQVELCTTKHGSHMGFLGMPKIHWMDSLLLDWTGTHPSGQ